MKLHFSESDSIYKIVQTIEKIPDYKATNITIHPENRIFHHSRRWTHLKSIIEKQHLNITFVSQEKKISNYFQDAWLNFITSYKKHRIYSLTDIPGFLKKINSFHRYIFIKKNYLSFFVILSEFAVLLTLLYVFWTLISPNAKVIITPAYQLDNIVYNFRYYPKDDFSAHQFQDYLSIPYYTGSINYDYDMSANVENITYTQEPAKWTFVIKNTFPYTYSLLQKTRVITDEGVIYTFDKRVDVPGWSDEDPGTAKVRVTAEDRYESWELIWEVWNIPQWKIAYIKNLEESTKEKRIWAEAASQFKYGKTIPVWTVIEDDIKMVEQNIMDTIEKQKNRHLRANYQNKDHIILPDDDLYKIVIEKFETTSELWEASSFVEGKVDATLEFPYVLRKDIKEWIETFLVKRAEDQIHLTSFDRKSLNLYGIVNVEPRWDTPGYYIIPTRLPVIKKYNIKKDSLGLVSEMKDKIAWLSTVQASKIILEYDEIDAVQVKITPRWYSIVPDIKSRITFEFAE